MRITRSDWTHDLLAMLRRLGDEKSPLRVVARLDQLRIERVGGGELSEYERIRVEGILAAHTAEKF